MNDSLQDMDIVAKRVNAPVQLAKFYMARKKKTNWAKLARAKGYRLERDTVLALKKMGIYAKRIPTRQQVGEMAPVDVIACPNPIFIQCKYKKKYFHQEERLRLILVTKKWNGESQLWWRDRGLKSEKII